MELDATGQCSRGWEETKHMGSIDAMSIDLGRNVPQCVENLVNRK